MFYWTWQQHSVIWASFNSIFYIRNLRCVCISSAKLLLRGISETVLLDMPPVFYVSYRDVSHSYLPHLKPSIPTQRPGVLRNLDKYSARNDLVVRTFATFRWQLPLKPEKLKIITRKLTINWNKRCAVLQSWIRN